MADEKERHSKVYNHAEKKKSRSEKPKEKPAEHKEPDGDEGKGGTGDGDGDEAEEGLATGAADEMAARHQQESAELDKGHGAELKEHADGQRRMANRHISQRKAMQARHSAEMMGGQMAGPAGPPDEGGAPAAAPPAPAV